jgi:hypothetical protein
LAECWEGMAIQTQGVVVALRDHIGLGGGQL